MKTLKVLFLAAEADPLVKVGGLADVAGSLPQAIQRLDTEQTGGVRIVISLVLPFHAAIRRHYPDPEFLFSFDVPTLDGLIQAQAYRLRVNGVPVYLIGGAPIGENPVYGRDPGEDGYKYVFFSLAALELAKCLGEAPHILHANDWHTALAVYALKLKRAAEPFFQNTRSMLTIHNLPFMGAGSEPALDVFGIPPSRYPRLPWWARQFPLPLGLQAADRIVTVSPSYAREIMTPEYGCGLEKLLSTRHKVVSGIVNRLDQVSWNPTTDAHIAANFTAQCLERRQVNTQALRQEFGLEANPSLPLLILVSRMDQQKGVDLMVDGLYRVMEAGWQAILLGTGNPELEAACQRLERDHPEKVRAVIRFDVSLSRRLYAGADILMMPSRYEPCGLAQMMAMRYGCVPLGRATGGLQDTIHDIDSSGEDGSGFLFKPATAKAFAETLQRALSLFPDRQRWAAIQSNGMRQDFSWEKSALQYFRLYQQMSVD